MVSARRQIALGGQGRCFDVAIDGEVRELEEVCEQPVVITGIARRPPRLEQEWDADRDLTSLDHARDLGTAFTGEDR